MFACFDIVSIHAPVKGRRYDGLEWAGSAPSFNPRPREGATAAETASHAVRVVSIHAPVKGRQRPVPGVAR